MASNKRSAKTVAKVQERDRQIRERKAMGLPAYDKTKKEERPPQESARAPRWVEELEDEWDA